ncbi:hypothetical protein DFH11DRAFT_1842816 [Phellopilus nigrolimitatus]|nr:hypothetical protein DFH11DRAFT_1842816 [Phellopilus nigrolimitatus]
MGALEQHVGGEAIDAGSGDTPHWLLNFPFRVKGKRKDDYYHSRLWESDRPSAIIFYENPRNRDFDEGIEDDSVLNHWNKLNLKSLRFPSSCISVDVSGNGFQDLIVTSDYGESLESMDPYGGRVYWLENFGTDEGDWTRRDIGRFPGINCVKVGHFSTTFSLQILAVAKSSRPETHSPLIVFTRPADVYKSHHWLVSIALEDTFTAIQDCLVVTGAGGSLDYVVVSSREGLTIVRYCGRSWFHTPISCVDSLEQEHCPGQMCAGRAHKGGVLSLYTKAPTAPVLNFSDIIWSRQILENFNEKDSNASILDLICIDLDGDGVDEIIVSVLSKDSRAGIYCYVQEEDLATEAAIKIVPGHFSTKNRLDLASLTCSLPREIAIHYNSFIPSQIKPLIEDSELTFYIPRSPSSLCETDIIDIVGRILSLVVIPPNASFCTGALGWIDSQSELIERTRAACLPGCVTSMLVDSPEGHVRSGNDGAVFVRMRPSCASDGANFREANVIPSYFPCDVCEYEFMWQRFLHLPGFHVRFDDELIPREDIAYVHFWTAAPGVSSGFVKHNVSQMTVSNEQQRTCTIRASLSNPSGNGGLLYCSDRLDWGTAPPTIFQIARARKMVLPVMYEHGPFWRDIKAGRTGEANGEAGVDVEYPWHAWVAGRSRKKGRVKWDVWAAFDFPAFTTQGTSQSNKRICTIC